MAGLAQPLGVCWERGLNSSSSGSLAVRPPLVSVLLACTLLSHRTHTHHLLHAAGSPSPGRGEGGPAVSGPRSPEQWKKV